MAKRSQRASQPHPWEREPQSALEAIDAALARHGWIESGGEFDAILWPTRSAPEVVRDLQTRLIGHLMDRGLTHETIKRLVARPSDAAAEDFAEDVYLAVDVLAALASAARVKDRQKRIRLLYGVGREKTSLNLKHRTSVLSDDDIRRVTTDARYPTRRAQATRLGISERQLRRRLSQRSA